MRSNEFSVKDSFANGQAGERWVLLLEIAEGRSIYKTCETLAERSGNRGNDNVWRNRWTESFGEKGQRGGAVVGNVLKAIDGANNLGPSQFREYRRGRGRGRCPSAVLDEAGFGDGNGAGQRVVLPDLPVGAHL